MHKTIVNEADSGIALMGLDGKFLSVNNMYTELLGYSKAELLQMRCTDITIERKENESQEVLNYAVQYGSISKAHKVCRHKNGNPINLEFSLTLLPDHEKFIAVINSMEYKLQLQDKNFNLEKEVENKVNELFEKDALLVKQSRSAAMGEMIDAIAHQWKNPLGVILLHAQMQEIEAKSDKSENSELYLDHAKKAEEQVRHLLETLEEFRSFFRPNKNLEEISVNTLIDSVSLLLKDELVKYRIELSMNGDIDTKINIVPNEFKHVLINLITNSKDAFISNNIEDKKINFEVINSDKNVIIKYMDNAGGIPENIIDTIFNANVTSKSPDEGTGIGMYMSKQIINKLGATITASNIDKGACFTITLEK